MHMEQFAENVSFARRTAWCEEDQQASKFCREKERIYPQNGFTI